MIDPNDPPKPGERVIVSGGAYFSGDTVTVMGPYPSAYGPSVLVKRADGGAMAMQLQYLTRELDQ